MASYVLPTRSSSEDPIFGSYLEVLPSNKLPLKSEIYRNFLYRRESVVQTIFQRNGKLIKKLDSANKNQIVHDLVECLKQIWWNVASIHEKDVEWPLNFIKICPHSKQLGEKNSSKEGVLTKYLTFPNTYIGQKLYSSLQERFREIFGSYN